ncbi:MAG TPA: glycosyltransferase family 4 protein [Hyphomicrobiaceae bacterium]|nr:glycosyltransferase family 4 protein [Hyphomicrobiaceae bacterium]
MAARRIMYVVTEDWFFLSHFRYMAEAAREAGYDVSVVARGGECAEEIRRLGFDFRPLDVARSSMNPFSLAANVLSLVRELRAERPEIVHLVALRSVLVGAVATLAVPGVRIVAAPTGLGYAWSNGGVKAGIIRGLVRVAMSSIRWRGGAFLFENRDDAAAFGTAPRASRRSVVVPGAGVDPAEFSALPLRPEGPLRVAVVGRMLRSKGIATAVDAVRKARESGSDVDLDIYGAPDRENPESFSETELEAFNRLPGVRWHGATRDVRAALERADVVMLLTRYREGVPRALIEGAAAGRALIATDVPGCRDVVVHGGNGFLVPVDGAADAAAAHLNSLAQDRALLARFGAAARAHFLEGFTRAHVVEAVVALYDGLVGRAAQLRSSPRGADAA